MEDVLITRTPRVGETHLRTGLRRLGRERLGVYRGMFLKRVAQWPLPAAFRMLSPWIRRDPGLVFADDRRAPDWLVAPSPQMSKYFARPFDLSVERCIQFGYPRNDHLVKGSPPPACLIDTQLYERLERRPLVVGYFPTWRYD